MRLGGKAQLLSMRPPGDRDAKTATVPVSTSAPLETLKIERLYDRHKNQVFHLALRYGRGSTSWAEDVTHDVFLDLFKVVGRLADDGDLGGWFYRATTNRCLNQLKRERFVNSPVVRFVLRRPHGDRVDPESIAVARSDLSSAFDAVSKLPPKERIAFFMHYVDGKEQHEIGRTLRHSKGYVSKLLERGRRRLREAGWEVDDDEK